MAWMDFEVTTLRRVTTVIGLVTLSLVTTRRGNASKFMF
jgi:hypothetical protein